MAMTRMPISRANPNSFGDIVGKWFREQPELEFLDLCCQSDSVVHFVRKNGSDLHVAAILQEGKFHKKIELAEDVWDKGVALHISNKEFFPKLHEKLMELYEQQR